jgi:hypothetical protein
MLLHFVNTAFATGTTPRSTIDFTSTPAGTITDAPGVFAAISNITDWIFSIFLVIAVIFIVYGAYKLLIAGGSPEALDEARKLIIYAIIAVVIAVLAKSIIIVAARIVGVTINI